MLGWCMCVDRVGVILCCYVCVDMLRPMWFWWMYVDVAGCYAVLVEVC